MATITQNNVSGTTVQGTTADDTITLTGRGSMVYIDGLSGNDTITSQTANVTGYTNATVMGGLGVDNISGFSSNSMLFGGLGGDTILLNAGGANLTVFGGQDDDIITASSGSTALIFGNMGVDTINLAGFGDGATVFGGQGDDAITGGAGSRAYISGDLGDDSITGVAGSLTSVFGGQGRDTITTTAGATQALLFGQLGDDNITAAGTGSSVFGGQGSDTLTLSGSSSILFGNQDNDTITVSGGATSATVFGGQGSDTITATAAGANAYISGDLGNDTINAGAVRATILGGDGNDSITNSNSQSLLTGGTGSDIFSVNGAVVGANNSTLTISDFVTGTDFVGFGGAAGSSTNFSKAQVNGGFTAALAAVGGNNAAGSYVFVAGSTDGYLFYNAANGQQAITLSGSTTLASFNATDIIGA